MRKFWGRLLVGLLSVGACAATFEVPTLTGPVIDEPGALSPRLRAGLEHYLSRLEASGGSQIEVVILKDLGGVSIEEATIKMAERWQLGRKGRDEGIILALSLADHKIRIEVGRGHEGELPDLTASRIVREVISPELRSGDFDQAVKAGVLEIVRHTDPDFVDTSAREARPTGRAGARNLVPLLIFLFILLPLIFRGGGRGGGGGGFLSGLLLGNLLGGGFGGGGRDDRGGGWSGGGGGFSGGGASGDW